MKKSVLQKRLLMLVIVLSMLLGVSSTIFAESDYASHWARLDIQYLVNEDIVSGYSDGNFRPDRNVTRAEFMKMINGAFGFTDKEEVPFADVKESDWFYNDVAIAIGEGYTTGYEDNTVKPNNPISRQEAAVMVDRALDLEEAKGSSNNFTDSYKISNWAVEGINSVVEKGYMKGYPTGDFKPLNNITRAETASIIINVLGIDLEDGKMADLKVHYIDVGQGDSIFIQLPNGQTMLIDGGTRSSGNTVVNYLDSKGVNRIDYLVATHPHEDHIGGLLSVVNNYGIGQIYMPRVSHNTQTFENLLLAIQSKGYQINNTVAGTTILDIDETLDKLSINILAPESNVSGSNLNNNSVVIKLDYNNNSFLFTGDAETGSEYTMINKGYPLNADVLKIAHHGSNTSTSNEFLDKVDPSYAVISYAKNNSYGHPNASTINKLNLRGIDIYSTALSGNIIATSDGFKITFNTKKSEIIPPTPEPPKETKPPVENKPPVQPGPVQSSDIYITKTGSKYHLGNCSTLRSKISISLNDAKSRGYEPCKVCNPPR